MKAVRLSVLIVFSLLLIAALGVSKPEFTKKEGKVCTFCHPPGKFKELTEAGRYYRDHNFSLEGYKSSEAAGKM